MDLFQKCKELYEKIRYFEYGIPVDGIIKGVPSAEYYVKNYHFLKPEEFEKYGGGICWDYVEYERKFLEVNDIDFNQYYLITNTPPNYDTHTFITVKDGDELIYIESSFKRVEHIIDGVQKFKSLEDIVKLITTNMWYCNDNDKHFDEFKYDVCKFKGHPKYDCTCQEYMDWMDENSDIVIQDVTINPKKVNEDELAVEEFSVNKIDTKFNQFVCESVNDPEEYDETLHDHINDEDDVYNESAQESETVQKGRNLADPDGVMFGSEKSKEELEQELAKYIKTVDTKEKPIKEYDNILVSNDEYFMESSETEEKYDKNLNKIKTLKTAIDKIKDDETYKSLKAKKKSKKGLNEKEQKKLGEIKALLKYYKGMKKNLQYELDDLEELDWVDEDDSPKKEEPKKDKKKDKKKTIKEAYDCILMDNEEFFMEASKNPAVKDLESSESKDIYHNIDLWESGKCNLMWVTGLSGSGKSTIAKEIANVSKAEHIELDDLQRAKLSNWKSTGSKMLDDYIKSKGGLFKIFPYVNDMEKPSFRDLVLNEGCAEQFNDLIKYIISYAKSHGSHKYTVEGVQLAFYATDDNINAISQYPVVIKMTGPFKAEIRRIQRLIKNKTEFKEIFKQVSKRMSNMMKEGFYKSDYKKIKDFKSNIGESYVIDEMLDLGIISESEYNNLKVRIIND